MPTLLLLLLATPASAGLFGSDAPRRIPVPARDISASVEDVDGVRTQLARFTFDGEVYLFGEVGRAQVTVAFEDIDQVVFEPTDDEDWRTAVVRLKAGDEVRLKVEHDRPLFGRAHYGNYRIEAEDVRVVEF